MFKENMFNSNNEGERRPRPRFRRESEPISARPRFRREDGESRPKPFGERSEFRSQHSEFRKPFNGERSERPFNGERPNRPNRPFGGKPKRNNNL